MPGISTSLNPASAKRSPARAAAALGVTPPARCICVEAAAQQGKLEAMYTKMYQAQKEWAEQQVPKDDVFRQYAQELGLDMGKWDAAYNSKETLERIQRDTDDGTALGVQGTPTFFFNGKLIEPKQMSDLTRAFDQALAE